MEITRIFAPAVGRKSRRRSNRAIRFIIIGRHRLLLRRLRNLQNRLITAINVMRQVHWITFRAQSL